MVWHRVRSLSVGAALALLASSSAGCDMLRDTVDVLYVGNSYIYFNNLPEMVEEISTALEGPIVRGDSHTHGGSTLRGHIEDGHLPGLVSDGPSGRGGWDWVVLQEQSTLGADTYDPETGALGSPDAFHGATRELVAMIRAEEAQPMLYMTWAKDAFPAQSSALAQAYQGIGTELGVNVAPVGEAWAEVRRLRPDLSLYVSDGSHPNAAGSYLAACVIYAAVTGRSPVGAPRELTGSPWSVAGPVESSSPTILVSLPEADAAFLQEVAWSVVNERAANGGS